MVVVVNYDYVLWYLRMEFEIVMLIIFDKYRFGKYKNRENYILDWSRNVLLVLVYFFLYSRVCLFFNNISRDINSRD